MEHTISTDGVWDYVENDKLRKEKKNEARNKSKGNRGKTTKKGTFQLLTTTTAAAADSVNASRLKNLPSSVQI